MYYSHNWLSASLHERSLAEGLLFTAGELNLAQRRRCLCLVTVSVSFCPFSFLHTRKPFLTGRHWVNFSFLHRQHTKKHDHGPERGQTYGSDLCVYVFFFPRDKSVYCKRLDGCAGWTAPCHEIASLTDSISHFESPKCGITDSRPQRHFRYLIAMSDDCIL